LLTSLYELLNIAIDSVELLFCLIVLDGMTVALIFLVYE